MNVSSFELCISWKYQFSEEVSGTTKLMYFIGRQQDEERKVWMNRKFFLLVANSLINVLMNLMMQFSCILNLYTYEDVIDVILQNAF